MSSAAHRFHRWINPAGRSAPGAYDIEAEEAERISLAEWLGIPAVRRLTGSLRLRRESADSVSASGTFAADVDLICGVTLDPFGQAIAGTIEAVFHKDIQAPSLPADTDVEINIDTEEPRPWTGQGIDLGALLAEELSLALPDFPRKPGAELPPEEAARGNDERPNPFAVLARLPRSDA